MPERRCPVCAEPVHARRSHAVYCSPACRAEASRLRRILSGETVDGFDSLPARLERRRIRTESPETGPGEV